MTLPCGSSPGSCSASIPLACEGCGNRIDPCSGCRHAWRKDEGQKCHTCVDGDEIETPDERESRLEQERDDDLWERG